MQLHAIIYGRVQGVWYRGSTREVANQLGLIGWVRNLPDGTVEVLAQGPKNSLKEILSWLYQGPRFANVTKVAYQYEEKKEEFHSFKIRD